MDSPHLHPQPQHPIDETVSSLSPGSHPAAVAATKGGDSTVTMLQAQGSQHPLQHGDDARSIAAEQEVMQRAKEQLQEALALLPSEEKQAYAEAVRRCPHLVEWESPAERYLRFDNMDPWAAAKRIADYWEARLDLFGPDRAYLPLVLSGRGALSEDDLRVLKTGVYMVLPDDTLGRPVLLQDRARLTCQEVMNPSSRLRCLFYVLSAVAERENCQETGFAFLSVFAEKTRKIAFDMEMCLKALSVFGMRAVIPIRLVSAHHVLLSSRPSLSAVLPQAMKVFEKMGSNKPESLSFHTNKPLDDLHADLRKHGFHLEGLPKVPLNGLFTFGCLRRWLDDRARQERHRCKRWKTPHDENDVESDSEEDGGATSVDAEDEATRKRRALEAAYARRKRARKRIERRVHEAEVDRLLQQREALRQEADSLEELLRQANAIARKHEKEEEARQRRRSLPASASLIPTAMNDLRREATLNARLGLLSHLYSSQQPQTYFPMGLTSQESNILSALMLEQRQVAAQPHRFPSWNNAESVNPLAREPVVDRSLLLLSDFADASRWQILSLSDSRLLSLSNSQLLSQFAGDRTRDLPAWRPDAPLPPPPPSSLGDNALLLRWLELQGAASAADSAPAPAPAAGERFVIPAMFSASTGSVSSLPERTFQDRSLHAQQDLLQQQQEARFQELYRLLLRNELHPDR